MSLDSLMDKQAVQQKVNYVLYERSRKPGFNPVKPREMSLGEQFGLAAVFCGGLLFLASAQYTLEIARAGKNFLDGAGYLTISGALAAFGEYIRRTS